jgi:hypothetical protein
LKSDAILSFIENFPMSASLKEADTGRYVINNKYNSMQFGIDNPLDLVGLTIKDVRFRQPEWGARYARMVETLDFRACEEKTAVFGLHEFLDDSGEAQLEKMVKFPLLGKRKNILGIATYRYDLTPTLRPYSLYRLYRQFYDGRNSITRVLVCLEIDRHFVATPTDAQFRVFLLRAERFTSKRIAGFLGMSDRTVEYHLNALRNKVVDGNLPWVLSLVEGGTACDRDFPLF